MVNKAKFLKHTITLTAGRLVKASINPAAITTSAPEQLCQPQGRFSA
jgi:hypothetical protein